MLDHLHRIINKPSRLAIGLISGTSVDGIDAALVRLHGHGRATRIETLAYECVPHPAGLRDRIFDSFHGGVELICQLNFDIAEAFAEACGIVAERANVSLGEVDIIASHGQTIYHIPPDRKKLMPGSTLQIGDGNVIAARTGCLVVSDFRTADMAAGGDGAPLVPLADYYLFHDPAVRRIAGNIGGIANITILHESLPDIVAFDTGPGNMLIDAVAQAIDPALSCDRDGALAAQGTVEDSLLNELLSHQYFQQPPPKTTGRELFGVQYARTLLDRTPRDRWRDLAATVTAFTARSMADAMVRWAPGAQELVLAGGGIHNPTLMRMLREATPGLAIRTTADFGVDPDAREAIAFAILGNETIHGSPGNVPSATGASRPAVLGKISFGYYSSS